MTDEELKAALESTQASIKALEAKNKELKAEKDKAKTAQETAQAAADEAAEEAARKDNDAAALEKSLEKKYAKQIADLTSARDAAQSQLSTLLIDNTAQANLTKHNVPGHFHKPLLALIKAQAELKDGAAMVGDTSLDDYIATYLTSDEGKHFVSAPANSGANATGGKASTGALPSEWSLTRYMEIKTENPSLAASYASTHGKKF
jgi:hypothetical protein